MPTRSTSPPGGARAGAGAPARREGQTVRDRGRLIEQELPDRVRFRSGRSASVTSTGALTWARRWFVLLVVAAPIAFAFGVPAGVCVAFPLGTLVLLCLVLAAQARAFRGLVIIEPRTVDIMTDDDGYRTPPPGPVMSVDGYPIACQDLTRLKISHHAGSDSSDEDTFSADLVTRQLFIELDSFNTAAGAQALAAKLHARLAAQQVEPELDLTPRPAVSGPRSPLLVTMVLWAVIFGPLSLATPVLLWPGGDQLWSKALLGMATAAAVVLVELLLAAFFSWWLRASVRRFLERTYGIVAP